VGEFRESIASLLRADLLRSSEDDRGEILYFEESARRALDLYRNSVVHYLAAPSFLARRLLAGPAGGDLRGELAEWLDLFFAEYYVPRGEVLAAHFDGFIDHFERLGWVERSEGQLRATEKGAPRFAFLAEQTRGVVEVYSATLAAVSAFEGDLAAKALVKAAAEQFGRADLLGEVLCPESLNDTTIANAISLLVSQGVLARSPEAGKKGEAAYVRGPAFGDLPVLRERLAAVSVAR
jgi:glycerol-3-phosphate O-acyltransferase